MKDRGSQMPKWAATFLKRICPSVLSEAIIGDTMEQFEEDVRNRGVRRAKMRLVLTVIRFMHPAILLRNQFKVKGLNMEIFKNHFKVAFRSILKHRFYSTINVLGLSISIAFVFLSYLFIENETSYDTFHQDADRIYRVYTRNVDPQTGEYIDGTNDGVTSVPLGPALKEDIATISHATRYGSNTGTVTINNIPYEETITMVDQDFLEIFSYPVLEGRKSNALEDLNSILITPEKASKFFGDTDPLGKTMDVTINDSTRTFIVAGVIDNKKAQTGIRFDVLVPFDIMGMAASKDHLTSFDVSFVETWVRFKEPVSEDLSETLTSVINTRTSSEYDGWEVNLQPLASVHFDNVITGLALHTNPQKLWSMGALVLLVLVIAIINFIALTTGHSFTRVKEMGLRKTLGTFKSALRFQLVVESFVFTLGAGILGVLIAWLLLPSFNQLIEATIPESIILTKIGFVLVLVFVLGAICGFSQSAFLVRVKPVEALKGTNVLSSRESWLNQGLIVLQFAISVLLIIGTLAIRSQLNYIQKKDLGFDTERLVEISSQYPENLKEARLLYERFSAEALKNPAIIDVGASMNSFQEPWTQLSFRQEDGTVEDIYFNLVNESYLKAMQIELHSGEAFSKTEGASTSAVLVNEELVKRLEMENPIGEQIPGRDFHRPHKIIGVMKNFHYSSLHNEIEPMVIAVSHESLTSAMAGLSSYVWPPNLYQLIVRVGPGDLGESLAFLEETWKKVNGSKPFSYAFIDDSLANNYAEEARWQKLTDVASGFAIVIAWMGLLGLMRISVQKRTKEIGIRKVLGSSIFDVTFSLSKKFLILIGIANLIAWPVAWWGVNQWLQSFQYRIDMNVFFLLAGGLAVVLVAMLSVGFQARRAASLNPVECLRDE